MSIEFRLVEEDDAEFILRLRTDPKRGVFLNKTPEDIVYQRLWIRKYKERETDKREFYYIIFESGVPRGTYRLYNINNVSFTIGSWLFESCNDITLPIRTDLFFSGFGFNSLDKSILLFDVRKENKKVLNYHLLKQPLLYNEDTLNFYFLLKKCDWNSVRQKVISYFGI